MAKGEISFGKWLLGARKAADLTQQQLADCAGLKDKSYIGLLENETPHPKTNLPRIPSVEMIKALAECVNRDPLDAFKILLSRETTGAKPARSGRDKASDKLVDVYRSLSGARRKQLIEFAEFLSRDDNGDAFPITNTGSTRFEDLESSGSTILPKENGTKSESARSKSKRR